MDLCGMCWDCCLDAAVEGETGGLAAKELETGGVRLETWVCLLYKGFVTDDTPPLNGGVRGLALPPTGGPGVTGDRLAPKLGNNEPPLVVGVPPTGGPDVDDDRLPRNVAPAKAAIAPGKKYCKPITISAIPIIIAIVIAM